LRVFKTIVIALCGLSSDESEDDEKKDSPEVHVEHELMRGETVFLLELVL
jgi:hypothetical protein